MKQCLECGTPIARRRFCSKKCSALFRSKNTVAISESVLRADYEDAKLELQQISEKHGLSITTLCKYLRRYGIAKREKWIDFSGRKIGSLQVIEPVTTGHKGGGKHIKWKCICECGSEHIAYSHHLSRSISPRCGACAAKARRSRLELKHYMWTAIERGAKNRGLEFSVDRDWAYNLYLAQERRCALTGAEIGFAQCAADHKQGYTTASLDRIDSFQGYVEGNVQWVHKMVNFMKGELAQGVFVEWCRRVVDFSVQNGRNA